jgi:hypothetical protein
MWAILSGIEGNFAAYQAVLKDLSAQPISDLYILGDSISLHPDSHRVIEALYQFPYAQIKLHVCTGWWEEQCFALHGIGMTAEPEELITAYGSQASKQLWENVSRPHVQWLREQHFGFIELEYCLLIHGSSVSVSEKLTPSTPPWQLLDRLQRVNVNLLFCGRSGLTFEYELQSGVVQTALITLDNPPVQQTVKLEKRRRIVGVGTVGRNPGLATYTLYDPNRDRVLFKSVAYAVNP